MDKIEKIRRKIEELQDKFISIHPKDCSLELIKSYAGYAYLDKVLSFIDTLEEKSEIPTNLDLEKEIDNYLHSIGVGYGGWVDGMEDEDLKKIARHFYNIGRGSSEIPNNHDTDREEIIGLSIMAYLDTHLKHEESVVCRGVNHFEAREWIRRQIKRIKSEPINNPNGLDEAAEKYYQKAKKHLFDNSPIGDCRHAFKAGAEWATRRDEGGGRNL